MAEFSSNGMVAEEKCRIQCISQPNQNKTVRCAGRKLCWAGKPIHDTGQGRRGRQETRHADKFL